LNENRERDLGKGTKVKLLDEERSGKVKEKVSQEREEVCFR